MMRWTPSLALVLLLGSAPALAQSAAEGIDAASQKFETAFNGGESAALADLYTEDAALLPPGAPRVEGKEDIATFWQDAIDAGITDLNLSTSEVVKAGDLAFETGSLTLNATNPEGAVVPLAGKYTVVWQRDDDGVWRMHRDIWNIDQTVK
jgi:uncharacterized protein (TIGR02246 family)